MIGYAICGSFCTHKHALNALTELVNAGADVQPIVSETAASTDTRFGKAKDLLEKLRTLTAREPIITVKDAEPLGPSQPLSALIIAPCTGNTLAKMANGITDTSVCMAAKAHLRSERPLLICLATNDALSANLKNIATMLSRKNVYFVPMRQDDPISKPSSLVADFSLLSASFESMQSGHQLRPVFRE